MTKKQKSFTGLLACLLLFGTALSGCSRQSAQYTLAAGPASEAAANCAKAVSQSVADAIRGAQVTLIEPAQEDELSTLLQEGSAQLALLHSDEAAALEEEAPGSAKGVISLYREALQLVATQRSGITSLSELRAKRISIGADGSKTQQMALALLDAAGIARRDVQIRTLSLEESVRALREEQLDAYFTLAALPDDQTLTLSQEQDLMLVPIKTETAQAAAAQHPLWSVETITGSAYGMEEKETASLCVTALLVCQSELSDAAVKTLVQALCSKRGDLPVSWKGQSELTLSALTAGMTLPLHPAVETALAPEA